MEVTYKGHPCMNLHTGPHACAHPPCAQAVLPAEHLQLPPRLPRGNSAGFSREKDEGHNEDQDPCKACGVQFLRFPTKSYTPTFILEVKNRALVFTTTGRSTLMDLKV